MKSDNDKAYNIILIEDDESDAELIELRLKKLDINTRTEVISNEEQLNEILENRPPDLIISDYNLPGFTGIQALEIVRNRYRNLPFISVTGFLKEDEAVDMMLKGASDYVMKDQLERLGPAVVRELSNYSMRKKQEVNSRLIEAIFENRTMGIAAIDNNGNYVMVNKVFASMSGYGQEELIGLSLFDLNASKNREEVEVKLKRVIEKGESHKGEWPLIRKDGLQLDVQSTLSRINYMDVNYLAISFVRDITEEKKLRQEREEALIDLQERIKEQQCLYEISRLDELALSVDEMLSIAVRMTPGGFSYPGITEVQIRFSDKIYQTDKFKKTDQSLKTVNNRIKGKSLSVHVVYTDHKPERDEGPFLHEERQLINSIADQLSLKIDRKLTQAELIGSRDKLKKLNRDLKTRAEELAISNAELERFAYVASHDLQEPLRMVSGFMNLLEKKYRDQLDEKARQYIQFAVDGSGRMRRIILDLLEYSRIGKNKVKYEEVDLNKILDLIVQQNQSKIERTGAELNIPDLPVIKAAASSLEQMFQNLISNALKYRHSERKPVIRVDWEEQQTHWQFSVSDNGIGIESRYYEKVFDVFQRLHNKDEYTGTGIGLAICKKIAENYGGEIWVESDYPKGSTFYFTICKNLEQSYQSKF